MSRLRDMARRAAPPGLRSAVRRAKKSFMGPSLFEVELGDYRFAADPSEVPRLTLVLPGILRRNAFGGVNTGLDLFCRLAQALRQTGPLDLRLILTNPEDVEADNAFTRAAKPTGLDISDVDIRPRCFKGSEVAVRKNEVFMAFNWTCAGNLRGLLRAQAEHFDVAPRPMLYPIQEYEPNFYTFSSDHLLAREVYDSDWPIFALVNSSQLARWLEVQGHSFARTDVFEPQLSAALRPFLKDASSTTRKKQILVYGRPAEDRNCFPILRKALQIWAEAHPEQAGWSVLSAGTPHRPVPLAGGRQLQSVGKLSLEDYARMLCETAVGISLMASPHPSYPPFEMAHFGLRTLTNRFAHKDLGTAHDNIVSLADSRPDALAQALAEACRAFEADPSGGVKARSHMPDYLGETAYPFLDDLAQALQPFLQ
ncbi:hypothetical protein So717_42470 [Roseobacter cerasinus]|uniref:Uncharacterized protein n=1 Tax=Roseobacter cerasinus TaxID=2602289 RepID=A0A640VY28_9RHOB|nr:hypothetical protein [Roseobacter cerasinus]GFE52494.1 hypothetical protein So717_42470 [Roseobacter cerasinus]